VAAHFARDKRTRNRFVWAAWHAEQTLGRGDRITITFKPTEYGFAVSTGVGRQVNADALVVIA
jgi:hypothetical protein